MPKEREEKKITRRQFLAGSAALVGSALLSGCGPAKESSPTQQPSPQTETKPSPTLSPTLEQPSPQPPTPEISPTVEMVNISGVSLTEDYLKEAFAGVGGEEQIDQKTTVVSFGEDYVSASWGKEIGFAGLSEDPIASLKYMVSLGAYRGEEGVFLQASMVKKSFSLI